MAQALTLTIDGAKHALTLDDPQMPLLYALRDELGMDNPRFGCGLGQCGACTVHIDGEAVRSCVTPVASVGAGKINTLASLGTAEHPHPLQAAFIAEQAPFCGYCLNGWLMTAAALIKHKPRATEAEVREGLSGLKCRCGSHMAMIRAVLRVTQA